MKTHQVETIGEEDIVDISQVHAVSPSTPRSYKISVKVNSIPFTMELDTGSSVTLVSETTWVEKLNQPPLQPCTLSLQSYPNNKLIVLGQCQVHANVFGKEAHLPLIVVKGSGPPLF